MMPRSIDAYILTAIQRSQVCQRPILLSVDLPAPAGVPLGDFYWSHQQEVLIAGGREVELKSAGGKQRFCQIKQAIKFWRDQALGNPYFIGGFAFYDQPDPLYPPSLFYVPQWLWRKIGATITWTANVIIQPTAELAQIRQLLDDRYRNLQFQSNVVLSVPPQVTSISELMGEFSWAIAVDKALQLIQQGQLEKLVLARFLDIEAESAIHLPLVLANLQQNYAECTVFCFDLLPHSYLVGASPELLLHSQFQHNQLLIETLALAGSIPRGNSPTRDQILGAQLLHSAKDLQEHQIVINSIVQALAKIKADIAPIAPPQLMPLANVQHLCTPITAKISTAEPLDIFDLMAELHPTAAMAGSPKDFALPLMQRYEPSDRGWYAAPLGWLDCLGNAMFVVCIRSALISANKARLFAGSGIIANSNIQQEIIETNAKFNPILHALGIKEFA